MSVTGARAPVIRRRNLSTLEEFEAIAVDLGWQGKFTRIGPDTQAHSYHECIFSSSRKVTVERYPAPVSFQSGMDSNHLAIGMYLSPEPAKINGMTSSNDRFFICFAGSDYEVITPGLGSLISIQLPQIEFEPMLNASDSTLSLAGNKICSARIDETSSKLLHWYRYWISSFQPGSDSHLFLFQKLFDEAMQETLSIAEDFLTPQSKIQRIDKCNKVKIAELIDYFHAHTDQTIQVDDMTRITGLGRRNMFYQFKKYTGFTPVRYLTMLRLGMVRRKLVSGYQDITRLALTYDFSHLGEFSALYKRIYGELPSDTRKRVYCPALKISA
jgi:AraC-like DNA-binding protein